MTNIKDLIIQQTKDKFTKTNSGITVIQLMESNNLTYTEIKPILSELHSEKIIIVRKGINNNLIYLRDGK